MEIDITGLSKAELLMELHNGTKAIGMGKLHDIGPMSLEQAQSEIARRYTGDIPLKFDYVCGRPVKVDISGDVMKYAELYDRDAGNGAAANVVSKVRSRSQIADRNETRAHPFK